ncbi:hypothetical protein PR048_009078, partial [Dryococelus australis]
MRDKHKNQNKINETIVRDIRDHINLLLRIDSHYCRKGNDREFIDGVLDISQIYRLYVEKYPTEPSKHVALKHKYESVFNTEFNIAFIPPKERSVLPMHFIRKEFTRRENTTAAEKHGNQCITQKCSLSGDLMHSLIERKTKQALKSCPLFVPSQIAKVAKTTGKPYKVQQVDTTAILNWKSFCSPNCKNIINVSAQKEKVIWNQVKVFEAKKKKKKKNSPLPAHSDPSKITVAKKKGLLQLCSDLHIPKPYHFFYEQLQTASCETVNAE